jgi:hypothetical protein
MEAAAALNADEEARTASSSRAIATDLGVVENGLSVFLVRLD